MVQLHNPLYSPGLNPRDVFLFTLLITISPDVDISPEVLLAVHCSVSSGCMQKVNLSAFRAWILRLETAFLSRENRSTG